MEQLKRARIFAAVTCLTMLCLASATLASKLLTRPHSEDDRLNLFINLQTYREVMLSPYLQAWVGMQERDQTRWDKIGDTPFELEISMRRQALVDLSSNHDYSQLSETGKLSYKIFQYTMKAIVEGADFHQYSLAFDHQDNGVDWPVTFLRNYHRIESLQDAKDYITRLHGIEPMMHDWVQLSQSRAKMGITPPAFVFPKVIETINDILDESPISTDFETRLVLLDLPIRDRKDLIKQARNAIDGPVRRGYQALLTEVTRLSEFHIKTQGVWAMPDGEAYYNSLIRSWTSQPLSADQVYQLGLKVISDCEQEIRMIMASQSFDGTLQEYFHWIDQQVESVQPPEAETILNEIRGRVDEAQTLAPKYFNRLPKSRMMIEAADQSVDKMTSEVRYRFNYQRDEQVGSLMVNLSDPSRILHPEFIARVFHEAIPGHHFQVGIVHERDDLLAFRRMLSDPVVSEGWAMYAEQFALEMGLYNNPLERVGMLQRQLSVASRLVVDTGIHSRRWTKEQAIEYMNSHTALSMAKVVRLVESSFVNPGHGLIYLMGAESIMSMRKRAEIQLGSRFDIRAFHDLIIADGLLPLPLLEKRVDDYIQQQRPTRNKRVGPSET